MSSNTILFAPCDDIEEELKIEITDICTANINKQVIKADLEDNQKRWLLAGICLQSILYPTLRKFSEPVVLNLYNAMKISHRIHIQTYPNQLIKYPKPRTRLNYEAINNNHSIKIGRKPNVANYDYKVVNHVEFSKLFMQTYMANIDTFPQPVKNVATKLRTDVRNPWAHCNLGEWDTIKYQMSFQLMHQLIKCLNLNISDETFALAELTKWETNGFMFLQGYAVDQHVISELKHQTQLLAEYALKMNSVLGSTFRKVQEAMFKIDCDIRTVCTRTDNLELLQNEHETSIKDMHKDVDILYERTSSIQKIQTQQGENFNGAMTNIKEITQDVENLTMESTLKINRVEKHVKELKSTTEDIKCDITEIKEDVVGFKDYMTNFKPTGKIFFYSPNRSESFVAREKEMSEIKSSFVNRGNEHHTLVIYGLGGCGKTTLAVEFAWRSQEFYMGGIFWMSAESENALEDSIATLAIDVNTTGKDFRETFKRTLKWFSNLTQRWLMVVDNADEEYLSDYTKELLVGPWKRNTLGHIIITTRRESTEIEESLFVKLEYCICLSIFETEAGIQFLKRRTGRIDNKEDNAVQSLVEELGGLPLALEQAAAHIKSIKCSFADYVKRFEKKRIKLLKAAQSPRKISKFRLTVATTWQLNIEYISRESKNADLGTAAITTGEIILECLASVIQDDSKEIDDTTSVVPYGTTALREMGNKAFKDHRFHDAIQYYTEGIRSCSANNNDSKLYANRSLAYIKTKNFENALNDANSCIKIASDNWKGYCWKAYSIAELIKIGSLSSNMEAVGLASACIASHKHKPCLDEPRMKICYPNTEF
ncbi:unnamed protein product [Mytilus edulis]|uniref:NB-ARC domain-containing protein n=1 Tax=Mytilus edulis TaxID=6550 RepID=A0A8S3U8U8_MYTED|nr:unnamed protein product [Mytilus edulis]